MNRAERRRLMKKEAKADKTINFKTEAGGTAPITQKDLENLLNIKDEVIDKMKAEVTEDATYNAFLLTVLFSCVYARDKLGFGEKRMCDFVKGIMVQYSCFNDGYVKFSDMIKALCEEINFNRIAAEIPAMQSLYKRIVKEGC